MAGVVGAKGKLHMRDIYAETAKKDRPREGCRSKYFSLKEQSRLRALKRETGGTSRNQGCGRHCTYYPILIPPLNCYVYHVILLYLLYDSI